jgi:hypothetical protein
MGESLPDRSAKMWVQVARLRLVEARLLDKKGSSRGIWEISDAGRVRLKCSTAVAA